MKAILQKIKNERFNKDVKKSRLFRNLCNSPLNLPPLELKYEPVLNRSGRKLDNNDLEVNKKMSTTNAFSHKRPTMATEALGYNILYN